NILDADTFVRPLPTDINSERNLGGGFGTGILGTNVFNFATATIRCTEDVNGFGAARVYVTRSSTGPNGYDAAVAVNYRIDFLFPDNNRNDAFRRGTTWEMPLQAGSDYAAPDNPVFYSANTDFTS